MNDNTTRRCFLLAAGTIVTAAALPLVTAPTAQAAGDPLVLTPTDQGAIIPDISDYWHAEGVSREPLNSSTGCGAV